MAGGLSIDASLSTIYMDMAGYAYCGSTYDGVLAKLSIETGSVTGYTALDGGRGAYFYMPAVDPDHNVYVTGMTSNGTNGNFLVAKYDSNLGNLWKKAFDVGNMDYARSIMLDASGYPIVAGHVYNGSAYDIIVAHFQPDGTIDWQSKLHGAESNSAFGVTGNSEGDIFVADP